MDEEQREGEREAIRLQYTLARFLLENIRSVDSFFVGCRLDMDDFVKFCNSIVATPSPELREALECLRKGQFINELNEYLANFLNFITRNYGRHLRVELVLGEGIFATNDQDKCRGRVHDIDKFAREQLVVATDLYRARLESLEQFEDPAMFEPQRNFDLNRVAVARGPERRIGAATNRVIESSSSDADQHFGATQRRAASARNEPSTSSRPPELRDEWSFPYSNGPSSSRQYDEPRNQRMERSTASRETHYGDQREAHRSSSRAYNDHSYSRYEQRNQQEERRSTYHRDSYPSPSPRTSSRATYPDDRVDSRYQNEPYSRSRTESHYHRPREAPSSYTASSQATYSDGPSTSRYPDDERLFIPQRAAPSMSRSVQSTYSNRLSSSYRPSGYSSSSSDSHHTRSSSARKQNKISQDAGYRAGGCSDQRRMKETRASPVAPNNSQRGYDKPRDRMPERAHSVADTAHAQRKKRRSRSISPTDRPGFGKWQKSPHPKSSSSSSELSSSKDLSTPYYSAESDVEVQPSRSSSAVTRREVSRTRTPRVVISSERTRTPRVVISPERTPRKPSPAVTSKPVAKPASENKHLSAEEQRLDKMSKLAELFGSSWRRPASKVTNRNEPSSSNNEIRKENKEPQVVKPRLPVLDKAISSPRPSTSGKPNTDKGPKKLFSNPKTEPSVPRSPNPFPAPSELCRICHFPSSHRVFRCFSCRVLYHTKCYEDRAETDATCVQCKIELKPESYKHHPKNDN